LRSNTTMLQNVIRFGTDVFRSLDSMRVLDTYD